MIACFLLQNELTSLLAWWYEYTMKNTNKGPIRMETLLKTVWKRRESLKRIDVSHNVGAGLAPPCLNNPLAIAKRH